MIIGRGPGGVVAAVTARKNYSTKQITLIRKEEKAVIPCGIPYIFSRLNSVEQNLMLDQLLLDNKINLVIGEVEEIKASEKQVVLKNGDIFRRFNSLAPRTREEWIESTLNKVNAFLSDDRIREIFSFQKSSFFLREIMDSQKILLIKLDRGRLKENADLIGSLLMTKIRMAAFSRSDVPREKRIPFYLYIDEFQNFATKTFIDTLSEARKYGLSLIMAHQNLSQLPKDLQDSILTNCGIQCYFRVSRRDAEILAKEAFETTGLEVKASRLSPRYFDYDFYSYPEEWKKYFQELQQLPNRCFYAKHKIEGEILPLQTADVLLAYEEFGIEKEKFEETLRNTIFGSKYLLKRKELLKETKEVIAKEKVPEKEEKPRTLEEIIATMTPLEKAILWSIGVGNYNASDIYEEGNRKLKEWGCSTRHYKEFKKKFYEFTKLPP